MNKNDKLLPVCPLCLREIPPGVPQSLHHLIPKLKGGKNGPTILVHHICHKEIHAAISEGELAKKFNSIETLKAHPRLSKFLIGWLNVRQIFYLRYQKKEKINSLSALYLKYDLILLIKKHQVVYEPGLSNFLL